ncbi:hypothetical protein [Chitinimonas taiwanensis]|uniref:hypothetical protein n=1 Tax=Chitinimonas taiwanensis TaxID=240412 RepID=UPI000930BE2B|nr:hypothetical protein [Chitinimonas taiwanensis]
MRRTACLADLEKVAGIFLCLGAAGAGLAETAMKADWPTAYCFGGSDMQFACRADRARRRAGWLGAALMRGTRDVRLM